MPLLGMFSKKPKQGKRGDVNSTTSLHSTESTVESSSPTTEYIRADRGMPSSPNGRSHLHPNDARSPTRSVYPTAGTSNPSSSKLRLFGRKKGSTAGSVASDRRSTSLEDTDPQLPPPRPSFAAYGDTDKSLSTRSLPAKAEASLNSPPASPTSRQPKRPFFNWSKSANATPSKPAAKGSTLAPPSLDDPSSFNLKSFRHVRPPSPSHSVSSTASLSPPMPVGTRPRGASTASDSSQRISVAAFREAQARRSAAGSPAPSLRSQSPHGVPIRAPSPHALGPSNKRSMPHVNVNVKNLPRRPGSRYDSDTSEEDEEEESDEEEQPSLVRRRRTVTQRHDAKSGPANDRFRATRSEMGHGRMDEDEVPTVTPRSTARQRASKSTSAMAPSPAARRASQIANLPELPRQQIRDAPSNPTKGRVEPPRRSTMSSDSSSDSDDDAPLARLIPPRRPGSAMSNNSNRSNRSNVGSKPLIDINTVIAQPPKKAGSTLNSPSAAFTPGATLLSSGMTSTSPPSKFVSPPGSPVKASRLLSPIDTRSPELAMRKAPIRKGTGDSGFLSPGNTRVSSPDSMSSPELPISRRPGMQKEENKEVLPPAAFSRTAPRNDIQRQPLGASSVTQPNPSQPNPSRPIGHRRASSDVPPPRSTSMSDGMSDLASMLGGGIRLISKNGESESSDEEDDYGSKHDDDGEDKATFKPIPIQRREPPPAFSVTSRPQHKSNESLSTTKSNSRGASSDPPPIGDRRSGTSTTSSSTKPALAPKPVLAPRQRSSTMMPTSGSTPASLDVPRQRPATSNVINPRPRSSSMMPMQPLATKPFASPASSTGDSSSGMQPLTPRDGSDITGSASASASGKSSGHAKRRSVSFEDSKKEKDKKELTRRRNEAKAAIDLGNVVNGRGPIMDEDEETPVNQAPLFPQQTGWGMPMMNMPMNMGMNMNMNMPMNMNMNMMMPNQMLSPAHFMPPPADPAYLAAHQQAMMMAKQAYQIAVAQQAMAVAADEWERQSSMGGLGGGSVYGGGGSVYGGGGGGGWGSQSMYGGMGGGGGARSEYGGGWGSSQSVYGMRASGGGSGAKSAYGGDSRSRQSSSYFPTLPPMPSSGMSTSGSKPGTRTRTVSQPASPAKRPSSPGASGKKRQGGAPPSSWRPGM